MLRIFLSGVPQGRAIQTKLFSICINDVIKSDTHFFIRGYQDFKANDHQRKCTSTAIEYNFLEL